MRHRHFALFLLVYLAGLYRELMVRHANFQLELDSASVSQIVWLFNKGLPLNGTILGKPILGEHFCPAFLALIPLVRGFDPFHGLVILQVLCSGLVLCMAYLLAREILEPASAAVATLGLALGPLLVFVFLYPTPFLGLGLAGILLHYWGAATDPRSRWGRTREWLGILLAATCYEPCLLVIVGLGLYRMVDPRSRRQGLLVTLVSLALMSALITVVIPSMGGVKRMNQTKRYEYLLHGKLPPALTENPGLASSTLGFMALGGGWLAFTEPALLLTILPGAAVNFLSTLKYCYSICLNYQAYVLPGLFLIMLRGIQRHPDRQRHLAGLCLFFNLASWGLFWRLYEPFVYVEDAGMRETYRQAIAQVPPGASLLAPAILGSQVTDRQEVFIYPGNAWAPRRLTEWLILDLTPVYINRKNPTLESLSVRDFLREADFQVRWRRGPLVVLQQGSGQQHLDLPELDPLLAAECYRKAGFHPRAALYFGLAAQRAPQDAELWTVYGLELELSGDLKGAKEAFRKALDCPNLDPRVKPELERRVAP